MKPEQKARGVIDKQLKAAGWVIQDNDQMDLGVSLGVAVREFHTSTGPVDYALFVEGKPVGVVEAKEARKGGGITSVEQQSSRYIHSSFLGDYSSESVRFAYEATGIVTRFTDFADIKPRSRGVYCFHRPETLQYLIRQGANTIRNNFQHFPELDPTGLRKCQIEALEGLDSSFATNKPRALVQMATGAGKTFTAISSTYRLLKYGKMKRVLFLVDTRNLGQQAEREFQAFKPTDDQRQFSDIYGVTRLHSPYIPKDSTVYISTIQRLYSILCGKPIKDADEETSGAGSDGGEKEVRYNKNVPPEFFDCIIVDECHRSIYNVWMQVLEYFDAFIVGLTATPDGRTIAFFRQNLVSEYTRHDAIIDGVNVPEEIFLIETQITKHGATVFKDSPVLFRERYTHTKQWEQLDDDLTYTPSQLNGEVVNPSQIHTIIRAFKENIFATLYPERREVPKTLIFAKDDSHADDIVKVVREEFGESNDFCRKITYSSENAEALLSDFRNAFYPRIAVTVDMIATGTDVKSLECLLFMRDVRSKNYYEQMIGRGTRTLTKDELQLVSPSATDDKDHFVIIDAVGVTTSAKTETCQIEHKPGISLKELMESIARGDHSEEILSSTANRLIRLSRKMTRREHEAFSHLVGCAISTQIARMLDAYNQDETYEENMPLAADRDDGEPDDDDVHAEPQNPIELAAAPFHDAAVRAMILDIYRTHRQLMDLDNTDFTTFVGRDVERGEVAEKIIQTFHDWIAANQDTLIALGIIYAQPHKLRSDALDVLASLALQLRAKGITEDKLRQCYDLRDGKRRSKLSQIADLVSLIRYEMGLITELTPFAERVRANYKKWIFAKNAGNNQFTDEQNKWLQLIRDHIATSLSITEADLDLTPFGSMGGLGKFYRLFGAAYKALIEELNLHLVA